MKKIGFCMFVCLCVFTQLAPVYGKSTSAISSEIDRNYPSVSVQFGKTKLNVGNELTLLNDKENKNIWFAGNQIDIKNLDASNLIGAGGMVRLDEKNQSQLVLIAGDELNIQGEYQKVYLSGSQVVINSKSESLNVAGDVIEFTGTANNATLTGNTVIINGKVTGQLKIAAQNIVFKDGAKIEGYIKIWSDNKADLPGKMTEEQIMYYPAKAIKWGFLPPLNVSLGAKVLTYSILFVTTLLFSTLGVSMLGKVLRLFKGRNWRHGVVQLLILLSDPILLALALVVLLKFTFMDVWVMYLAMWFAITPIIGQRLVRKVTVKKRLLFMLSLFSIGLYELLTFNLSLGWWLVVLNILFIVGAFGADFVKNKKIALKVKP